MFTEYAHNQLYFIEGGPFQSSLMPSVQAYTCWSTGTSVPLNSVLHYLNMTDTVLKQLKID